MTTCLGQKKKCSDVPAFTGCKTVAVWVHSGARPRADPDPVLHSNPDLVGFWQGISHGGQTLFAHLQPEIFRFDIPKNRDFPSDLSRSQSSHDPPWFWSAKTRRFFGNTNSVVESDTAWRCWWVVSPRKKVQLNNPPRTLIIRNFIINNIE